MEDSIVSLLGIWGAMNWFARAIQHTSPAPAAAEAGGRLPKSQVKRPTPYLLTLCEKKGLLTTSHEKSQDFELALAQIWLISTLEAECGRMLGRDPRVLDLGHNYAMRGEDFRFCLDLVMR